MDSLVFCILLAVCVALLGWGLGRVLLNPDRGERKRVQQRLSGERRAGGGTVQNELSLLLVQRDTTGLSAMLAKRSLFQTLARKLQLAWPGMSLVKFFILGGAVGVVLFLVLFVAMGAIPIALAAFGVGPFVPYLVASGKFSKRQKVFGEQLPEALDFLSRILRAGHSLSTGLQMMGTELPEPLSIEFRRSYDQHTLGAPLEECLKDMADRIELTDFYFFVTAVLIQRQTGGDLAQVLNNISGMIRQRLRLQSYVRAKTAEGRFTGYILVAFPIIMFFITYSLNPTYSGTLLHTSLGLKLMSVAGALEVVGMIAINKLTTVKV